MKILVLHNREVISKEIEGIISETDIPVQCVDICEDIRSARDCLESTLYDLLISDLTVPYDAKRNEPGFEAVRDLLHELYDFGELNIPGDLIGITRDLEALSLIKTDLGPHFMVTIQEDDEGRWKAQLRDRIEYAFRTANSRIRAQLQHFDRDALIVTAMDQEFSPYYELFDLSDSSTFAGAKEFIFSDCHGKPRTGVAYSIGTSGQPSAASLVQSLISWYRPQIAIMSGYCGGIEGKLELGDLVFFEAASAWDYGKWLEEKNSEGETIERFVSRPNPISIDDKKIHRIVRKLVENGIPTDSQRVERIKKLSEGKMTGIQPKLAQVASGSAVVANDRIVAQIEGLSGSIRAVDMECYGFYYAAKHTRVAKPEFLCVKAVSDYCNGEKDDAYHDVCSYISAIAVEDIVSNHWIFE